MVAYLQEAHHETTLWYEKTDIIRMRATVRTSVQRIAEFLQL